MASPETKNQKYVLSDKKLCYCQGTAQRAMLVNSCYVSRGMGVKKLSNSKSDLKDHSTVLTMVPFDRPHRIPISILLQLCLNLAPLTRYRYYHLFPKI